jgi:hypothetical protein
MRIQSKSRVAIWLILVPAALMAMRPTRPPSPAPANVLTWHNDNSHTGQYLNEVILSPSNVNSTQFGKLGSYPVDGQIYAQPLYWKGLNISGQGSHDVVFVATENDSVYAFDADNPGANPNPLWHASFTNPPGVTAIPCGDITSSCHVDPVVGITGTPVIDPTSKTLYVIARTKETAGSNVTYPQRLHALDITTGAEKFGGPVTITASVGSVTFDTLHAGQRPGLLMIAGKNGAHNVIYIAWAGFTDKLVTTGLNGWVMAYDGETLAQLGVFNTTPNGKNGGIWGSGGGLAADSAGTLYASTGDGNFDASTGGSDYGDSLIKLLPGTNGFTVEDYFTPKDQTCRRQQDLDLGSGGPMLLPPQTGSHPSEMIAAGKGGSPCDQFGSSFAAPIYVVNRNQMGHFNSQQDRIIQTVQGAGAGYWSAPAYWQGQTSAYVYYCGITTDDTLGDYLRLYTLSGGLLSSSSVSQSPGLFLAGCTPSISANGATNGIAWAIERQDSLDTDPGNLPAILHAYDATNVATELYNSSQAGTRDQAGAGVKFQVPTIANGKVYVGTQSELDIYGLLAR